MARFVKGDIVVLPFSFSDLSANKRRPALVLADLSGDDIILCQITSQATKDIHSVSLKTTDLKNGSLNTDSYIRPNRLFTAEKSIILYKLGSVNPTILKNTLLEIKTIFDL